MSHRYAYPRAALTVDCVIFGFNEGRLQVLLIERGIEPFKGQWALPGGFVRINESLEDACRRELEEETGLRKVYMEQLYTFGDPGRDPRERVVSVAYYALVKTEGHILTAGTDAARAAWFPAEEPPPLAFDHAHILSRALERLRGKVRYEPIGFELLPRRFTLTELQRLYETILGTTLDKRNFRKKLLAMDLLVATDEYQTNVRHRAARLYKFDARRYAQLRRAGFHFEL
jgi:8-oxo-dGTP diphosphatase